MYAYIYIYVHVYVLHSYMLGVQGHLKVEAPGLHQRRAPRCGQRRADTNVATARVGFPKVGVEQL